MSLPSFIEAGDLTVNPRYVISVRRYWAEGISGYPEDRRLRARVVMRHGSVEELEGDAARRLFEGLRPMVSPVSAPEPPGREGHDDIPISLGHSTRASAVGDDPQPVPNHAASSE